MQMDCSLGEAMPAHLRREGTARGLTPYNEGFCKTLCVSLCCPQPPCSSARQGHRGDVAPGDPVQGRVASSCCRLHRCPQPLPSPSPAQPGRGSSPRSCCGSRTGRRLDQIGWTRFLVTRKTTTTLPSPSQPSHTHICHA